MSSYTITIAPDDPSQATTTLRVAVTDTATRITELLVQAGNSDELSAGQLPILDLNQLTRAITAAVFPPATHIAPPLPQPAEPHVIPAVSVTEQPQAQTPQVQQQAFNSADQPTDHPTAPAAQAPTLQPPAAPIIPSQRKKTAPSKTQPAQPKSPPAKTAARQGASDKPKDAKPAKRAAKKAAPIASSAADGGRTYRKAPQDLAVVFRQAGTATAIADHYDVPKHTAYGWIRNLKKDLAVTAK